MTQRADSRCPARRLSFFALEEFDLPEPFFRCRSCFVRAAKVFAFARKNFVAACHFANHRCSSWRGWPGADASLGSFRRGSHSGLAATFRLKPCISGSKRD